MLPIATGGTRIGRIISVRINPLPRATPETTSASRKPSTISIDTEAMTKSSVVHRLDAEELVARQPPEVLHRREGEGCPRRG